MGWQNVAHLYAGITLDEERRIFDERYAPSVAFHDADRAERDRDYSPSPNCERAPEGDRNPSLVGAPLTGRVGPEPVAGQSVGWSAPAGPGARSQPNEKAA